MKQSKSMVRAAPTFEGSVNMCLVLLDKGTDEGKEFARQELLRYGRELDRIAGNKPNEVYHIFDIEFAGHSTRGTVDPRKGHTWNGKHFALVRAAGIVSLFYAPARAGQTGADVFANGRTFRKKDIKGSDLAKWIISEAPEIPGDWKWGHVK